MVPISVARVVRIPVVPIVNRPPPASTVWVANPSPLLDFSSSVCRDRRNWHCRCGGRCNATKCGGRKNHFYFAHVFLPGCALNAQQCWRFPAGMGQLAEPPFRQNQKNLCLMIPTCS